MTGERQYFVYILASRIGGSLYVGVTNDLFRRVAEHKAGQGGAYTRAKRIGRLVYFEAHDDVHVAIWREKRIKSWKRSWRVQLIEDENPNWVDRYPALQP